MILQYTSSNGQTYDLKVGHIRTRTANYHSYQWNPKVVEQQYGARVYRFDKAATTYTTLLSVFGSLDDRRRWLNLLHAAFEHDIINMTPGTITHGVYSIQCYVVVSDTFYENPFTQNQIEIFCPYPFWRKTTKHSYGTAETPEYEFLDFPYGFEYDYKAKLIGYKVVEVASVKAADWELTIHGHAVDPVVYLGGIAVGVNATIGATEKVVISSKDKTVTKISANGMKTNLFNARLKTASIFSPLPSGPVGVMWPGTFALDLTVYEERSEPLWI